jgi:hypothetical protein
VKSQRFLASGDKQGFKTQSLVPDKAVNGRLSAKVAARDEQAWAPKANAPVYAVRAQIPKLVAGVPATLRAEVSDASGAPVTDLQIHLNGPAYGVALSSDGEQFVRLEPQPRDAKKPEETLFRGTFSAAGIYRVWFEFLHNRQLIVAPFVVRVESKVQSKPQTKKLQNPT